MFLQLVERANTRVLKPNMCRNGGWPHPPSIIGSGAPSMKPASSSGSRETNTSCGVEGPCAASRARSRSAISRQGHTVVAGVGKSKPSHRRPTYPCKHGGAFPHTLSEDSCTGTLRQVRCACTMRAASGFAVSVSSRARKFASKTRTAPLDPTASARTSGTDPQAFPE